ncbi:hypothetical protein [Streptomyces sp. NPDC048419]|uniref:hypothetical protein n=1 Tax=Streptomyces sp. NPDC048419 TaxID=3365547 RepID=UPI003722E84E
MLLTVSHAHDPTGLPRTQLWPAPRAIRMPAGHLSQCLPPDGAALRKRGKPLPFRSHLSPKSKPFNPALKRPAQQPAPGAKEKPQRSREYEHGHLPELWSQLAEVVKLSTDRQVGPVFQQMLQRNPFQSWHVAGPYCNGTSISSADLQGHLRAAYSTTRGTAGCPGRIPDPRGGDQGGHPLGRRRRGELRGTHIPLEPPVVIHIWSTESLAAELRKLLEDTEDGSGPADAGDYSGLIKELTALGVMTERASGTVDLPAVPCPSFVFGRA